MKAQGQKITMLTAYDFVTAKLLDSAGVDVLLVGDSVGMVMLGYETTLPVTMEEMLHHTRAVVRGASRAMVAADMPFLSYQADPDAALHNAGRLLKEAGAAAVKLEGGRPVVDVVRRCVSAGIPVIGHLGLTPQSVNQFGGFKLQGRTQDAAEALVQDALLLEQAGACAIVLEKIPAPLARRVSAQLVIPTIGIGAGPGCDGQVLVTPDLLGLFEEFKPKFVRRYAELGAEVRRAAAAYCEDVRSGRFPDAAHSYEEP